MTIIDPTTDIGRLRLRVGDYADIVLLPDSVYIATLVDCNNYLPTAASRLCGYILGMLTTRTHKKLAQIEVFGKEYFDNYLAFVKLTILNPAMWELSPLPYTPVQLDDWGNPVEVPLQLFARLWRQNFAYGTQTDQMRWTAYPAFAPFDSPVQNFF